MICEKEMCNETTHTNLQIAITCEFAVDKAINEYTLIRLHFIKYIYIEI
jgi:hypothetical protein